MIVLFDLPVVSTEDRKAASLFRNDLLKMGFAMSQFSVYYKMLTGKEKVERYAGLVEAIVPAHGKVDIVYITDKQYANTVTLYGKGNREILEKPSQLVLF